MSDIQAKEDQRQRLELEQDRETLRVAQGRQQRREEELQQERHHLLEQEKRLSERLVQNTASTPVKSKAHIHHEEDDD